MHNYIYVIISNVIFKNVNSETVQASENMKINTVQNTNITPENLEFIGSHSMDMADPNTITAATSDTQINKTTVNSTQIKFPKPRLSRTQSI